VPSIDPLSDAAFAQAIDFAKDSSAADKHLNVRFFLDELKDEAASKREGRPIFKSEEFCEIRYGDKDNIVCERVRYMRPDPRLRFPVHYALFKAGESVQVVGTLLREWGLIDRSTAKGYEAIGIVTVEQLAEASDATAQQVRGLLMDRQKAKDFLSTAQGLAPLAAARAENADLRAQMDALRDQMKDLASSVKERAETAAPSVDPISAVEAPKRRGRPPGSKNKAPPEA